MTYFQFLQNHFQTTKVKLRLFRGRHSGDHMVVGFTPTCEIRAYHHLRCEFESPSWKGILDKTSCDTNQSVSLGRQVCTPVSSINKQTDRCDKTEILLNTSEPLRLFNMITDCYDIRRTWFSNFQFRFNVFSCK